MHNCKTVYCLRIYRRKKIITLEKLSPEKKIVTQQGPNGTTKEAPGPGKGYDQQWIFKWKWQKVWLIEKCSDYNYVFYCSMFRKELFFFVFCFFLSVCYKLWFSENSWFQFKWKEVPIRYCTEWWVRSLLSYSLNIPRSGFFTPVNSYKVRFIAFAKQL